MRIAAERPSRAVRPIGSWATLAVLLLVLSPRAGAQAIPTTTSDRPSAKDASGKAVEPAKPAPAAPAAADSSEPVILLTGFEPFGRWRTPNASWQGIKRLDGRKWNGYRIVAREMPVVWGAPLDCLPGWIEQYRPVAVFSFGMGGPGAFCLETVGSNSRGRYKDNRGKRPESRRIAGGGPDVFKLGDDSLLMARLLTEKGEPIRISTRAGRYLCEENLYSLQYLKKTKDLDAKMMFFHVPPLGTRLWGRVVTRDDVQRFVLHVLESWQALEQDRSSSQKEPAAPRVRPAVAQAGPTPVVPASIRTEVQAANDEEPRLREVRAFVEHYFKSWSDQDMDAYDSCFLPEAIIQYVDDRGAVKNTSKRPFVASQREVHRNSDVRNVEVPETIDVRMEGRLAHAVVFWKLTSGQRIQKGYDHFTVMKREGKWRIINLVFYATAVEE
jgi:pyroglutamyl-peptidase